MIKKAIAIGFLSMFVVFGMAPAVASAQSFGTSTGVLVEDVSGSPSSTYLGEYRYDSTDSVYYHINHSEQVYIQDNAGTYEVLDDNLASSTVYTSGTFNGTYTGQNSESGNEVEVNKSVVSATMDNVATGFTALVDNATNFIGDNIELIVGVMITLAVFTWFIGWLFGAFRRR